jgi:hypothetical protein
MSGLRGYDAWKTRLPDDHPEKFRRGKYSVYVERTVVAQIRIEVEASCESDAITDAINEAKTIPLDKWELDQNDYDTSDVFGPPERDPDDMRDEMQDREYNR